MGRKPAKALSAEDAEALVKATLAKMTSNQVRITGRLIGQPGIVALAKSPLFPSVQSLNLSECGLAGEDLLLFEGHLDQISDLNLSGNELGLSGVQFVVGLVETSQVLARLNLSSCGISDDIGGRLFIDVPSKSASLRTLNLRKNALSDALCAEIVRAITNSNLSEVSLQSTAATSETLRSLEECTTFNCLRLADRDGGYCDLRARGLTDASATSVRRALTAGLHLVNLDLMNNSFSEAGLDLIRLGVCEQGLLSDLSFGQNPGAATPSGRRLGGALAANALKKAKHADLNRITGKLGLGDEGTAEVAFYLEHNRPPLPSLGLQHNDIGLEGATALAKALPKLTSLRELLLYSNKLGPEGATQIALNLPPCLTAIDVGSNQIGDEGALVVGRACAEHAALKELHLDFNGITLQGSLALVKVLERSGSLQNVWLHGNEVSDESAARLNEHLAANKARAGEEAASRGDQQHEQEQHQQRQRKGEESCTQQDPSSPAQAKEEKSVDPGLRAPRSSENSGNASEDRELRESPDSNFGDSADQGLHESLLCGLFPTLGGEFEEEITKTSEVYDARFAEHVTDLVQREALLRCGRHLLGARGQLVLAAVVLANKTRTAEREEQSIRVVSLGLGTKFMPRHPALADGAVRERIRDSHGEILARRGFMRFLYKELAKAASSGNDGGSSILIGSIKDGFSLRPGKTVHLYVSTAPCGAASWSTTMDSEEQEDEAPKSQSNKNLLYAKGSQPSKATNDGEGLERKIAPCPPGCYHCNPEDVLGCDGLSLSCSNKVARWQVTGLQGTLLSNFIKTPIKLDTITIGRKLNVKRCTDALQWSPTSEPPRILVGGRRLETTLSLLRKQLKKGSHSPLAASQGGSLDVGDGDESMTWTLGDDRPCWHDGRTGGTLIGGPPQSLVSGAMFLESWNNFRKKFGEIPIATYREAKQIASEANQSRSDLRKSLQK